MTTTRSWWEPHSQLHYLLIFVPRSDRLLTRQCRAMSSWRLQGRTLQLLCSLLSQETNTCRARKDRLFIHLAPVFHWKTQPVSVFNHAMPYEKLRICLDYTAQMTSKDRRKFTHTHCSSVKLMWQYGEALQHTELMEVHSRRKTECDFAGKFIR